MYLGKEYSFKIDIWALGVILYILITGGILPFDDHSSDNKILAKKVNRNILKNISGKNRKDW